MFLLNQKFVKYRLGFVAFTIQNVPIKWIYLFKFRRCGKIYNTKCSY